MYDNYNYPAGADGPNAPWNQTELSDIYGDDANDRIDEEIDCKDDTFLDWAYDNDYLSEDYTEEDVEDIIHNNKIREEYRSYRFDDVVNELAEDEADRRAYYESERYEAYRERCLLGEN